MAGLAIAANAYGAHGLKPKVDQKLIEQIRLDDFEIAVRHQFCHALGLMLVATLGVAGAPSRAARWAGSAAAVLFGVGLVLFCGGLYGFAISGDKACFAAAPAGGIAFILGWFALALAGWLAHSPRTLTP